MASNPYLHEGAEVLGPIPAEEEHKNLYLEQPKPVRIEARDSGRVLKWE
jgi:hypothetical protein